MLEVAFVLAAVAAVGLLVLSATLFSLRLLALLGLATLAAGLLLGVPTGFWYHVVLYRIVAAKRRLPPRWWLSPSDLHAGLTHAEQRRIQRWYRLGGAGFVLCIVGGVVAIASLLATGW